MSTVDDDLMRGLVRLQRDRYDEQGWTLLYDGLASSARSSICRVIAGSTLQSSDVVHEAFLKLLRYGHFEQFGSASSVRAYFHVLARHAAFDALRAERQERTLPVEVTREVHASMSEEPASLLQSDQQWRALVGTLSASEARVLALFLHGLSCKTIAERLGVTASTIRVTLLNVRRKARTEFGVR